jgi:regulator of replication initiation timing
MAETRGNKVDFFAIDDADELCRRMASIVPTGCNASVKSEDKACVEAWEMSSAKEKVRTSYALRDDDLLFQIGAITFARSQAAPHWKMTERRRASGRRAYILTRNMFMGKEVGRAAVKRLKDLLADMKYIRESKNWGFNAMCQRCTECQEMSEWYASRENGVTAITNYEIIDYALNAIDHNQCTNDQLKSRALYVRGHLNDYVDNFSDEFVPYMMDAVRAEAPVHAPSAGKRRVARVGTDSNKRQRGAGGNQQRGEWGKLKLVNNEVVGHLEPLHYCKEIWDKMSHTQKTQVTNLRKKKKDEKRVVSQVQTDNDKLRRENEALQRDLERERSRSRHASRSPSRDREDRSRSRSSRRDSSRRSGRGSGAQYSAVRR